MKKIIYFGTAFIIAAFLTVYFLMPDTLLGVLKALEREGGGLEEKTLVINNMTIHYLEGGKGDPLILIHGFGADKDNWTRIGKFLTPHFRVIAPDLPGFGESSKEPGGKYTIKDQALFIKQFAKQIDVTSFHIGGSSMGGNIAGQYAFLFPDELKSLFLVAPGGVFSAQPSQMKQMLDAGEKNPLVAGTPEEYDRLLAFVFEKVPPIPGPVKKYLAKVAVENRHLNLKIFKMIKDPESNLPMETMLENVLVKTLILWGDKDRVLHSSTAQILGDVLKNSKVTVLENVGHLPMIEAPEKTADHYLEFLGYK